MNIGASLVFLWLDFIVWLLVISIVVLGIYTIFFAKNTHIVRKLLSSPIRAMAFMILVSYLIVGLLDCIHLQDKTRTVAVYSVLDIFLQPLQTQVETTYSKPFATTLFVSEIELIEGVQKQYLPRLIYGGAHLKTIESVAMDLSMRTAKVLAKSFILTICMLEIILLLRAKYSSICWHKLRYKFYRGDNQYPVRTMMLMTLVLSFVVLFVAEFKADYHILGTDKIGRDVLYAAIKSIRTGLIIGSVTSLVALPFAVFFGIVAGYFRGIVDDIVQFIYTTISSVPAVLLIAASILSLQLYIDKHAANFSVPAARSDARLLLLCVILGLTSWTNLCRLLRGESFKLVTLDYINAAKVLGSNWWRIIWLHLLPNLFYIVLIAVTLEFSGLVLAEAVLSYVGVGVDPTMYSWGNMINAARLELAREPVVWWSLAAAFMFMFTLVLAANIFADALRDALDPKIYA